MRGKQKQAQRTKDNVRPSNSGRSAQLLENSSGKLFSTLKNNANYISTASNQDTDANIPQDFQLCIKKMSKKDPITRQKGLQEFADLCHSCNSELVKLVLPFWPRLYSLLATDIDYRVREAAQQAHQAIVLNVKRDIAPYLKQLMGTWFVSPFDSHTSAANIAKNSFQTAFSPSKRTEAIVFAQKEILCYIAHNIIHETPTNLSNQLKHFSTDEINAKYQRIVGANLLAYSQYLDKLPQDQLLEAKEENKELILSTNQFWKYAKDKSKAIKAAWFTTLLTLIDKAPSFLDDSHKNVCTSIFTNFDEEDTNVLTLVWETALHSMNIIPNWWLHVSPEKLVLPKLWRVLEEGAFGNATGLYPLFYSLLMKISVPPSVSYESYYSKLISSLKSGVKGTKNRRNVPEMEAVISAFFECLRFAVRKCHDYMEVCLDIIDNNLIVLLKDAQFDSNMYGASATIFAHFSCLLRNWGELRTTEAVYHEATEKLWSSVHSQLCDSVTMTDLEQEVSTGIDEFEKRLQIQYEIIKALKNPGNPRQTNQMLRRGSRPVKHRRNFALEAVKTDSFFRNNLHKLVNDLVQKYFDMTCARSDHTYLYVNQLCNVLNLCSEKCYYQRLTEIVSAPSSLEEADKPSRRINNLIHQWLNDNRVSVDAVLNVVFYLLVYLKDDEKVSILNNISEDHLSSMLELSLNLNDDSQLQTTVQNWLSSSSFKTTLNVFAREILELWPPSMEKVNILKTCFRVPKNGESYTTDETKYEILNVFWDSLLRNNPQKLPKDNLSCLANILIEVFREHNYPLLEKNYSVVTNIIGYLFLFGCDADNHVGNDDILNEAWVLGVKALAKIFGCTSTTFINITQQFAYAIIELVEKSTFRIRDMKHIVNFICAYIQCLPMEEEAIKNKDVKQEEIRHTYDDEILTEPSATYAEITSLICEAFLKIAVQYCHTNMEHNVASGCLKGEYFTGTLNYRNVTPHIEPTVFDVILNSDAKLDANIKDSFSAVAKLYNVASYIVTVIKNYLPVTPKKSNAEGDNDENGGTDLSDAMKKPFLSRHGLERLNEGILYVVYLLAVLKSFRQNFKHARFYDHISDEDLVELKSIASEIVGMHSRSPILLLKLAVMNKAFQCGGFWAKALFLLFTELMNVDNVNEAYQEILKCHEVSDYRTKSHILHVSELFATVTQFRVDFYAPDAQLDDEKLSVLTCYLRANKDREFTSDQDRVIWYWLDTILIHKKQLEVTFKKNLMECKPAEILLAATVCRFLSVVSDSKIPLMTDKRTDFMMIALASWMQSMQKTCHDPVYEENSEYNIPICIFISAVCDMFKSMTKLAANVTYSDKLFIEWNNVFAADTHTIISYTWKSLAESDECRRVEQFLVLNTLSELLVTHVDFIQYVARPDLNFWLCSCSDLIQSYCTPVRLAAFHVLMKLSKDMVKQDSNISVVEDMDEKLTLEILSISSLQTIVNIVLGGRKTENERILSPKSDSYVYVQSYLLVWMVVMKVCEDSPAEVRYRYASWLKEEGYMEIFLHYLLLLLPEKIRKDNLSDGAVKKIREWFSTEPKFTFEDCWDEQKLMTLVCRLYYLALWLLPAFVRQWWKNLEHKDSLLIDKVTTKFVSPSLIMEEMKAIKRESSSENFTLKGYPTTRQIVAEYTVEDTTMELTMQLATNHPLGIFKVDSSKVGVLSGRWKTWAKQLNMYLAHQNGLIRDGIMSWKSNVDKAFEGVEECYICFSIVHNSNYQLPKQSCKTCHKKFHPLCLYRWFITSNKSSCPICRNHF